YNPPTVTTETLDYHRYYSFDHYRPVVESGAVAVARTPAEMRDGLRRSLSEPSWRAEQRRTLVREMFGDTLDGNCGVRIAELLMRLAGTSKDIQG
ncbi:MAG TPA: hypothetical protein VEC99_09855, partial [Clostridia bacterium]|nr:hypothetical protein [Clostridia bacterium]